VPGTVPRYLTAGTQPVWIVRPRVPTIVVHGSSGLARTLGHGHTLDRGDLLTESRYLPTRLFAA
jgi:hypothetical protein